MSREALLTFKASFRSRLGIAIQWILPFAILLRVYYPTLVWMVDRWMARDSYYGHGFLVPFVSLYWLFKKKGALAAAEKKNDAWGLLLLSSGVLIQAVSSVLRIYFLSAFSMVWILLGSVQFLWGRRVLALSWFPLSFLFLMIPLPLLIISEITLKMKFFVSEVSAWCLSAIGIQAVREGSFLHMPHAVLLVGDPCSGLRSFLAFLILGLIFAYDSAFPLWKRTVLLLAGFPLALLSNTARIFFLGLVAEIYGMKWVHGWLHDASGIAAFLFALALCIGLRKELNEISFVRETRLWR